MTRTLELERLSEGHLLKADGIQLSCPVCTAQPPSPFTVLTPSSFSPQESFLSGPLVTLL